MAERPLILVLGEWQADEAFRRALATPVDLRPAPTLRDEEVAPLLRGADAILSKRFTPGMAAAADRLRLILTPGAGTNQIDFAAVPLGVTVCNVFGHETAIAEYTFMAILALTRNLLAMDARFRGFDWSDRASRGPQREVRGRTLAVIGLGHIGAEVARLGNAFGMRVVGATRTPNPERAAALGLAEVVGLDDLPRVLGTADFVVVAVPLEASTVGLIGAAELAAMPATACLINVARGEVVDEAALYEALRDGARDGRLVPLPGGGRARRAERLPVPRAAEHDPNAPHRRVDGRDVPPPLGGDRREPAPPDRRRTARERGVASRGGLTRADRGVRVPPGGRATHRHSEFLEESVLLRPQAGFPRGSLRS